MKNFKKPVFEDGSVEFRIDNDEVSVYGTKDGLTRLSELCHKLALKCPVGGTEHVHLEDYELLTSSSLRATLAVFATTHASSD